MGMRLPELTVQHQKRIAAPAVMLPGSVLAALLAVLLLAPPLLCIIHCRVAMQPAHHSTPNLGDPISFFLCDLPLPTAASELFPPPFLPGALLQLSAFGIALALFAKLQPLAPAPLRPLLSPPSTPPPR